MPKKTKRKIITDPIKVPLEKLVDMYRYSNLDYKQFKQNILKKQIQKGKSHQLQYSFRCQICKNHKDTSPTIRCAGCQDLYHCKCVHIKLDDIYLCPHCQEELQTQLLKLQYVCKDEGDLLIVNDINQENQICPTCQQPLGEDTFKCFRCNFRKHKQCYKNTNQFCTECECFLDFCLPYKLESIYSFLKLSQKIIQPPLNKSSLLLPGQNTFKLYPPKFTTDADKLLLERHSLFQSLCAKSLYFSDELNYPEMDSTPELNNSIYEEGLQELDEHNLIIFNEFKSKTTQGIFPQILIDHHQRSGFIAKASGFISRGSLICEYTGEVKVWNNIIFDTNDSIMELLRMENPKKNLYVVPYMSGNIGRFVSGINNKKPQAQYLINIASLRVSIRGQSHILFYAYQDIKPNEILYYDYNSGGQYQYPTEDFEIL